MQTSFYTTSELTEIGFLKIGKSVKISRKASIYTPEQMIIGDHVRIDDFCILSGRIKIGSYVHISAYTAIYAGYGVDIDDYVTISGRVMIYSQNDDYSGEYMTNPTLPETATHVTGGRIILKKHAIVGAGSVILPALTMGEGACLGAMSLLKSDVPDWEIYAGIPAKKKGDRNRKILEIEKSLKRM
ncbi:MAG: acyltransferase [Paludibacter sp.]|nr:acyltransferase [Paludibacter sp.]MDD4198261.1 acyltransferase [Paludibacter sp.]MDD4428037.1 acyltransferase [Paludibacter sp.]